MNAGASSDVVQVTGLDIADPGVTLDILPDVALSVFWDRGLGDAGPLTAGGGVITGSTLELDGTGLTVTADAPAFLRKVR